jgi:zinc transport system ATP-binding protein
MGTPAVDLDGIGVEIEGRTILDSVSLQVDANDFLAIIGPNGGGKTTLLRVILGLLAPSSGRVSLWGEAPERRRDAIGYVPQQVLLDPLFPITVERVVAMGRLYRKGPLSRSPFRWSRRDKEAVSRALDEVGIAHLARRQAGRLSGGELQRVLIARALSVEPKLMMLDEPTANVDASAADEIYAVLETLNRTIPIILVSHDLAAVSRHVKTIGCLNRRLHYHHSRELSQEDLTAAYGCPIDLIAHGVPHRVLDPHTEEAEATHD